MKPVAVVYLLYIGEFLLILLRIPTLLCIILQKSNEDNIYLSIYMLGVFRRSQEYFIYTLAACILLRETRTEAGGNPLPSIYGNEDNMGEFPNNGHVIGK